MISKIVALLLFIAVAVKAACNSNSFFATTSEKIVRYFHYSNNDDCTVNIIPMVLYDKGYYLEIKWKNFDIDGNIPNCKDYVEVFLTRYKRSIGKYCSGNLGSSKLFNMYSSDGYASIRFKSDRNVTKGGFKFSYQLKNTRNNHIGKYGKDKCYFSKETSTYGLFYSSGWPRGYTSGKGRCYETIHVPNGKEARVSIMDLDLRNGKSACDNGNDYFQLKASSILYWSYTTILIFAKSLSKKHCGTFHPGYYTANKSQVYMLINKPFGSYPSKSNRGFMIGYIIYDIEGGRKSDGKNRSKSLGKVLAIAGEVLAGIIVLVIIFAICWKCCCSLNVTYC